MSKFASRLVNECLRIRADDNVSIDVPLHCVALAEDIAEECFRVGADVLLNARTDAFYAAYLRHLSVDSLRTPSVFCRGLAELSTAQFWILGPYDPAIFRKVPPEKKAAAEEGDAIAHMPQKERKVRSLWLSIGLVTRPRARAYRLPYEPWRRMILNASSVDPERLSSEGRRIAARLESGDRVRIIHDNGTDLDLSVADRRARVYDGIVDDEDIAQGAIDSNIPAGNVTLCPVETTGDGVVAFDVPGARAGIAVRALRWTFSGGRVRSFSGGAGVRSLRALWEHASGDRDRIATLSIGLNPNARLGFLSDPIVRGAITIGIGGNEYDGGTNRSGFYHAQTLAHGTLEVDGKAIVRRGKLVAA